MGELVEQDRDEEQDRRGERRGPDQAASPIRMPGGKYAGTEARGDQKEDDKQAPVDKDINAGNAAYSKSYVHRRSFPRSLGLIHCIPPSFHHYIGRDISTQHMQQKR